MRCALGPSMCDADREIARLTRERDQFMRELSGAVQEQERLRRERDEAQSEIRTLRNYGVTQEEKIDRLTRERDEARAKAKTLEFQLAATVEGSDWRNAKRAAAETENARLRAAIEGALSDMHPLPPEVEKRLRRALEGE